MLIIPSAAMDSSRPKQEKGAEISGSLGIRDFRLDADGIVMTKEQIIARRINQGQCTTCSNEPTQCFLIKKSRYNPLIRTKIPLTIDGVVYGGNCLSCHPEMDPDRLKRKTEWHRNSTKKLSGTSQEMFFGAASIDSAPKPASVEEDNQTTSDSVATDSRSSRSAPDMARSYLLDTPASGPPQFCMDHRQQLENSKAVSTSHIEGNYQSPQTDRHLTRACSQRKDHQCIGDPTSLFCGNESTQETVSPLLIDSTDRVAFSELIDHENHSFVPAGSLSPSNCASRTMRHDNVMNVSEISGTLRFGVPVARSTSVDEKNTNCSEEKQAGSTESISYPRHLHGAEVSSLSENGPVAELNELVQDLLRQDAHGFAVDLVATTIMENPKQTKLVEYGLWALWKLSREGKTLKDKIIHSSGLDAIVQCMATSLSDPNVQEKGCGALWSLAIEENNVSNITLAGGCNRVLEALSTHMKIEDVTARAVGAIRALSVSCDDSKIALGTQSAAQTVGRAMLMHLSCESIQAQGCHALSNLSVDSFGDVVSVCGDIEINAIAGAMSSHPKSLEVQLGGCRALRNYVSSPINIQTVLSCCLSIEKIANSAMKRFPEKCGRDVMEFLENFESLSTQGWLPVTTDKGSNQANRSVVVDENSLLYRSDSVDSVINDMLEDTTSVERQVKGLKGIFTLCEKSARDCEKIAKSPALDVIATAMMIHEFNESLQENAMHVLWRIAFSDDENKLRMVYSGVCGRVARALVVHKKESIIKEATEIMSVISEDKRCRDALKSL